MVAVSVKNLKKHYQVYKKKPGFFGSLKSLVSREHYNVRAVDNISFEIEEGELVGFIGPNGAGKTTTLKCLSGLLYPNSGNVNVLDFTPFERNHNFLKQIALVLGQKNQLWWDLPAMDSFILNKEIYEIPDKQFNKTVSELSELLDMADLVDVPVRKLSLGQRMKAELIAALVHKPKIMFLDEPTIGLDVVMQKKIRDFLTDYNQRYKTTVILTSHYMDDVQELCKRVIIIDKGKIAYDGELAKVVQKYARNKLISVVLDKKIEEYELEKYGKIKKFDFPKVMYLIPRRKAKDFAVEVLRKLPVEDLNIQDPPIEAIIREIFTGKDNFKS